MVHKKIPVSQHRDLGSGSWILIGFTHSLVHDIALLCHGKALFLGERSLDDKAKIRFISTVNRKHLDVNVFMSNAFTFLISIAVSILLNS